MSSSTFMENNTLPAKTKVLVVGAGPVGLACAITLAREGQQVIVVDALAVNPSGCRAGVIHANTMEVLDTIGCADALAGFGTQVRQTQMYNGARQVMELQIGKLLRGLTKFPFICAIPQHETERILREKLEEAGVKKVAGKKVQSYREVEGGLEVMFEDGDVIWTKYLVGADGSRSTVRHLAGIAFKDPYTGFSYDSTEAKVNSSQRMILSDIETDGTLPSNISNGQFTLHFSGSTLMMLVPLSSSQYGTVDNKNPNPSSTPARFFRFATYLVEGDDEPPKELSKEYVERLVNSRNHYPEHIHLKNIFSASRYTIRSALVDTFFIPLPQGGKILLAGDSAHVHSPAGGQGMNMGICDAVDLGRTIAAHSRAGKQDDGLLQKYAERRHGIADKVIRLATRFSSMNADAWWKQWLRDTLLYVIWSVPKLQSILVWRMSGLANREV